MLPLLGERAGVRGTAMFELHRLGFMRQKIGSEEICLASTAVLSGIRRWTNGGCRAIKYLDARKECVFAGTSKALLWPDKVVWSAFCALGWF